MTLLSSPFHHPETIKSDGTQRQIMVIRTPLLSRDKQVQWHSKTNYGHPHPFRHPETIKSDGTQRQIMVIYTLFAIQRQSSPMAHGDKLWSSAPFSLSIDKQVWWHAETIMVILSCCFQDYFSLLCHPETIKSDVVDGSLLEKLLWRLDLWALLRSFNGDFQPWSCSGR